MNPVVRERFRRVEKAMELQAREYERRLNDLNHENERIKESQAKSISVEKFDGMMSQVSFRIDQNSNSIKGLSDESHKIQGKSEWRQYIPWVISTILAVIVAWLTFK